MSVGFTISVVLILFLLLASGIAGEKRGGRKLDMNLPFGSTEAKSIRELVRKGGEEDRTRSLSQLHKIV